MTNQIGIMSGRLSSPFNGKIQSFPINTWKSEFKKASSCGFEVIEWIFDSIEKNPILDENGIKEIKSLSEGVNPLRMRRDNLIFYCPVGGQNLEREIVGGFDMTINSTPPQSEEPPIPWNVIAPG